MIGSIIVGVLLALPLLIGLSFRVSTSHVFFSLMAGELLGRYFGHDIDKQVDTLTKRSDFHGYGEIGLVIIPMILTGIMLRGTIKKGRGILHVIPLAITGIVLSAFVLPMLPADIKAMTLENIVGRWLYDLNKLIVGGMVILQLVYLWILSRKEKRHRAKHEAEE